MNTGLAQPGVQPGAVSGLRSYLPSALLLIGTVAGALSYELLNHKPSTAHIVRISLDRHIPLSLRSGFRMSSSCRSSGSWFSGRSRAVRTLSNSR